MGHTFLVDVVFLVFFRMGFFLGLAFAFLGLPEAFAGLPARVFFPEVEEDPEVLVEVPGWAMLFRFRF